MHRHQCPCVSNYRATRVAANRSVILSDYGPDPKASPRHRVAGLCREAFVPDGIRARWAWPNTYREVGLPIAETPRAIAWTARGAWSSRVSRDLDSWPWLNFSGCAPGKAPAIRGNRPPRDRWPPAPVRIRFEYASWQQHPNRYQNWCLG